MFACAPARAQEGNPSRYPSSMRMAALVVGVLLALLGLVWMGQGLGYVKGSFMTGNLLWFWIGLACLVAGVALVAGPRLLALRR
jgi:hypothetical protein